MAPVNAVYRIDWDRQLRRLQAIQNQSHIAKFRIRKMDSSQWEAANDAFHKWKKSFLQSQVANDDFSLLWKEMINVSVRI